MSGIPFHQTPMGRRFYESTMPELVRELARLNKNLERLIPPAEEPTRSPDEPAREDEGQGR